MAKERRSKKPGDFQQLLKRAAKGDEQVFAELLTPFREPLDRYCRQHFPKELEGKIDVSDVIQETLWNAWQSFRSFQGKTKETLASWLQVIMKHVIDDYLREYRGPMRDIRREVPLNSHEEVVDEARQPFASDEGLEEDVRKFRTVFPRLPKLYRQVLYLRKYKELTYREIAARIGGTAEGARKLHERAVKRFLQEWEKTN